MENEWKGSGCILLVDDEETILKLGRKMLERLGFEVITAVNGFEALDIYEKNQNQINIILIDLTMPRMDGEEVFREIRRINPGVRVILSSGYNEEDIAERFTGNELDGFIQKPYTILSLREQLQKITLKVTV